MLPPRPRHAPSTVASQPCDGSTDPGGRPDRLPWAAPTSRVTAHAANAHLARSGATRRVMGLLSGADRQRAVSARGPAAGPPGGVVFSPRCRSRRSTRCSSPAGTPRTISRGGAPSWPTLRPPCAPPGASTSPSPRLTLRTCVASPTPDAAGQAPRPRSSRRPWRGRRAQPAALVGRPGDTGSPAAGHPRR